jgi:hypothetical protein
VPPCEVHRRASQPETTDDSSPGNDPGGTRVLAMRQGLSARTRDSRQRHLPTNHRHAALRRPGATREYQRDSSSKRPRWLSSVVSGWFLQQQPRPPTRIDTGGLTRGRSISARGPDRADRAGPRQSQRGGRYPPEGAEGYRGRSEPYTEPAVGDEAPSWPCRLGPSSQCRAASFIPSWDSRAPLPLAAVGGRGRGAPGGGARPRSWGLRGSRAGICVLGG